MRPIVISLIILLALAEAEASTVTGIVSNDKTGAPVPFATVYVEGTGRSVLANSRGEYRLQLSPGRYDLKFSHISFWTVTRSVDIGSSDEALDVRLRESLIELPGVKVYEEDYDAAQAIVVEAIRRKQEILASLESYRCKAYVKTVQRNVKEPDSTSIEAILESQLECTWQHPDRYKQVITSRRQTKNLPAEANFLNIEAIPDFNRNRIEFGRYSLVSPVAEDALEYYDYRLTDTLSIDGKRVFRLQVAPKNEIDALVQGTVDIADSSFAIVGLKGGLGKGVSLPPSIDDFHYSQRFLLFEDRYWMPNAIHMTFEVNSTFPVEKTLLVNYVSALYDYEFNLTLAAHTFDYSLEVSETADDDDSLRWSRGQRIPLTNEEHVAYVRIDSAAQAPKPLHRMILSDAVLPLIQSSSDPYFFRFNRVEGVYIGYRHHWYGPLARMQTEFRTGYAFSRKLWQYGLAVAYKISLVPRIWLGLSYRDEMTHRPTILNSHHFNTTPRRFNPAFWNLIDKADPLDYYREESIRPYAIASLTNHTDLVVSYRKARQYSEENHTDFSILARDKHYRTNPAIVNGTLRSFTADIRYDSRPPVRIKGKEAIRLSPLSTIASFGAEITSPELTDSDFDFIRYYAHTQHSGKTILPGVTTLELFAGGSEGTLPPQEFFTVDFTYKFFGEDMFYKTVGAHNFSGDCAAAWYISNNFGHWIFRRSGLPLIKDIPLSISIYGGMFWTDFRNHAPEPDDDAVDTAEHPYSEIGFSLGRIRIPPVSYKVTFTWQLSNHDTNKFAFGLGLQIWE